MIITSIKCDHQKIDRTSVYLPHLEYADMHMEKMYKNVESHCNNRKHIRIIAGDLNAQFGLGIDSEKDYSGEHTTGQPNKRGIWMKQWLMIQNYEALNTIF